MELLAVLVLPVFGVCCYAVFRVAQRRDRWLSDVICFLDVVAAPVVGEEPSAGALARMRQLGISVQGPPERVLLIGQAAQVELRYGRRQLTLREAAADLAVLAGAEGGREALVVVRRIPPGGRGRRLRRATRHLAA